VHSSFDRARFYAKRKRSTIRLGVADDVSRDVLAAFNSSKKGKKTNNTGLLEAKRF